MSMVRLYKRKASRYSGWTTLERTMAMDIATVNPSTERFL
jgi:hypothetical protein